MDWFDMCLLYKLQTKVPKLQHNNLEEKLQYKGVTGDFPHHVSTRLSRVCRWIWIPTKKKCFHKEPHEELKVSSWLVPMRSSEALLSALSVAKSLI